MVSISQRLSVAELCDRILDMAKTGVYRESIFEALAPLATKKQIRLAIAHAKKFGLHSVSTLRDDDLGTYYQLDFNKYQSLHHLIHASVEIDSDEALLKMAIASTQMIQTMLILAKGLAIGLFALGVILMFINHGTANPSIFASAMGITLVWLLQAWLARGAILAKNRSLNAKQQD
jgi:hypothetical protein